MQLSWVLYENPYYDSTSPMVADLTRHKLNGASFSTISQGGFADGTLDFGEVTENFARRAIDDWLTKRVVATDGGGRIAYEGYVAAITARLDAAQMTRSIDPHANRLFVDYRYGGVNGSTTCPKGQTCKGRLQLNESDVETTTTQAQYGIKEEWLDYTGYGVLNSTLATNIATVKLQHMLRARDYTFEASDPNQRAKNRLSLTLWGYYTTLQWRKQSLRVRTLTDIGTIVANALTTSSKAPFISTDQSQIDTFGVTRTWNTDGKPLWLMDYIQGAIADGDANGREVQFQILEDRMPYLKARSAQPHYYVRYDDSRIWDVNHTIVPPYMVRAGGFMVMQNMIETGNPIVNATQRRHATYVERTTYDDITEKLSVPHSGQVISAERLLARARRMARNKPS